MRINRVNKIYQILSSTPIGSLKVRLGEWNVRQQNERLTHEDYIVEKKTVRFF